ncbi:hypothetical protein Smp_009250 [Schistosoma mansoni]|uniref:hypothetical protein n=1 Tax=Schistosoma mansoni TaxID=6183 RepID=UPI0001A63566|nr:hypothetical protein Smp_009250 [Schistosoma mansoni]|eukprot:XP_018653430.1 hypothetical protein Smp_009250 [Schistosoma mansoni]
MESRIKDAVERLDHLYQRLVNYKPLLDQNVLNAEFEIRANFKNLIELLSKRQSNLLIQLHNIAKEKSILIESNIQTIESLRNVLLQSCVTRNEIDSKISDYVKRAESITLTTDLAPFIAFHIENMQLNKMISTFGRLTSRYPGHFADPNKPSICLPQFFEEEEKEEIRIGNSTLSSTVFNRVQPLCICNDPTLNKWLSLKEHKCKRRNSSDSLSNMGTMKEEEDKASFALKNDYFWLSKLSEKESVQDNFEFNISRVPCCRPDSTLVRTWLELRDSQPPTVEPTSYHKGELYGLNNTLKPSNYSSMLIKRKAELRDMPGLSTKLNHNDGHVGYSVGNSTSEYSTRLVKSSWLIPENTTLSINKNMSTLCIDSSKINDLTKNSLFLEHIFHSGPIDLSRWLRQSLSSSSSSSPPPPPQSTDNNSSNLSTEQNQSINEEMNSTTSQTNEITTMNPIKNIESSDTLVEYCPKFGICQGGPGGPTCCGGCSLSMKKRNSIDASIQSITNETSVIGNSSNTLNITEMNSCDNNNNNSIVSELNRIANSDLKQWIVNDKPEQYNSNVGCYSDRRQQLDSVHPVTQNCLTSSAPQTNFSDIDMEIDGKGRGGVGELDEPDTLSNRPILLSPSIDISDCKSKEFNEKIFLSSKKSTLLTQKPLSTYAHWLI